MVTERGIGKRSYVGVSGVAHAYQAAAIRGIAESIGLDDDRDVLLGIKATHKTIMLGVENKYGADWYPVGDDIGAVARGCYSMPPWIRPVAQVFLEDPADHQYREAFTSRLKSGSAGLRGIQYDLLPWHEEALTDGLLAYIARTRGTGYDIYLQVHGPAMALGPTAAAKAFAPYAAHVTHVLFDSSHGTGQSLDVDRLTEFLDAFSGFGIGMGVAGGLGADLPLGDLVKAWPDVSWDAEGRLHPERRDGTRRLDLGLVEDYLRTSDHLIHPERTTR